MVAHVDAEQPVSFWMDQRVLLRRLRVYFLLLPLAEVSVLSDERDPLPGTPREHWLLWQSLTARSVTTRIPTDAGGLAGRLGLGRGAQSAAARAMLGELMAAIGSCARSEPLGDGRSRAAAYRVMTWSGGLPESAR